MERRARLAAVAARAPRADEEYSEYSAPGWANAPSPAATRPRPPFLGSPSVAAAADVASPAQPAPAAASRAGRLLRAAAVANGAAPSPPLPPQPSPLPAPVPGGPPATPPLLALAQLVIAGWTRDEAGAALAACAGDAAAAREWLGRLGRRPQAAAPLQADGSPGDKL